MDGILFRSGLVVIGIIFIGCRGSSASSGTCTYSQNSEYPNNDTETSLVLQLVGPRPQADGLQRSHSDELYRRVEKCAHS